MASLGEAVVEIGADTSGFRRDVQQGVNSSFNSASKSMRSGGTSLGKSVMGPLTAILKRGAMVAGGVAVAGIGTALAKGFGRLNAIDQAEAKLSGLGHTAGGVQKIMDNALKSVEGTAFGLGDAATIAAGTVAAGIKPGKDLERVLSLVGDAATIAGVDLADMGSVFNKVAAGGKVTGESLQSLTDRGIPILKLLGDELGTTAEETKKMVSSGEVSFKDFANAIENGMGGAAQKSGETFQGALANVGAAMGRLGAKALGPGFDSLPALFGKMIEKLDALAPVAERVGEVVGLMFDVFKGEERAGRSNAVLSALSNAFKNLRRIASDVLDGLKAGWSAMFDSLTRTAEKHGGMFDSIIRQVRRFSDLMGDDLGPALKWVAENGLKALAWHIENVVSTVKLLGNVFFAVSDSVVGAVNGMVQTVALGGEALINTLDLIAEAGAAMGLPGFDAIAADLDEMRDNLTGFASDFEDGSKNIQKELKKEKYLWNLTGEQADLYKNRLLALPNEVRTLIETPGVADSLKEVRELQREYGLSPDEVFTVIQQQGGEFSIREIRRLNRLYGFTPKQVQTLVKQSGVKSTADSLKRYQKVLGLTPRQVTTLLRQEGGGLTMKEVGRLHKAYTFTPKRLSTLIQQTGADPTKKQINNLIERYDLTEKQRTALLKATDKATPVIDSAISRGQDFDGKAWTATMTIQQRKVGGGIPAFAGGTTFAPGGVALVGERGPELVELPRGSRVHTAQETRNMASATSQAGVGGLPSRLILRVGAREFTAYVEEIADGRIEAADSLVWQGA